jgi:hypothetical protein
MVVLVMALRVVSLGAGVQSSALLLLALTGQVGRVDAAIFADTGFEPAAVYGHLWRLAGYCVTADVPLYVVAGGDIRTFGGFGTGSALDVPFYVTNHAGGEGLLRRQCTSKLKVAPVRRQLRALMRARDATRADLLYGISADEALRMRRSDVAYVRNVYPLVERGWRRADCAAFLALYGITAPRSACLCCPYHTNKEWRAMRDDRPDEWAAAVAWEREAQAVGIGRDATPFVHRQRVPLDAVDLTTPTDHGQLTLDDECEGFCGL